MITNFIPTKVDDYSSTVSEMREVVDPGESGSESQATTLAGEITRIRNMLKEITGKTYWYETPAKSLAAGSISPTSYIPFDGSDTLEVYKDCITRGVIPNALSKTALDLLPSYFNSTTAKFGSHRYDLGTGRILAVRNRSTYSGALGVHFKDYGANSGIAFNPLLGIDLKVNNSGYLEMTTTVAAAATESTKDTRVVTGTNVVSGSSTYKHALMKYAANGVESAGRFEVKLNGTTEGSIVSSTTAINHGNGGVWFIGCKRNDPTWDHYYAAGGLPSAHSSAWAVSGSSGAGSVSGGVLTIETTAGNPSLNYNKTGATVLTGVNFNNMTFEFKARFSNFNYETGGAADIPFSLYIRDDSEDRSFNMGFSQNGIITGQGSSTSYSYFTPCDTSSYHVYRIAITGSAGTFAAKIFVDGVLLFTQPITSADATANDYIQFGDAVSTSGTYVKAEIEYLAYADEYKLPYSECTAGSIDDLVIFDTQIDDSAIESALSTTKASSIASSDSRRVAFDYHPQGWVTSGTTVTTASTTGVDCARGYAYFISDGITPVYFNLTANLSQSSSLNNITAWLYIAGITKSDGVFTTGSFEYQDSTYQGFFTTMNHLLNVASSSTASAMFYGTFPPGLVKVGVAMKNNSGSGTVTLSEDPTAFAIYQWR